MIDTLIVYLIGGGFGLVILIVVALLCRWLRLPWWMTLVIYFGIEFAGLFWSLSLQGGGR